MASYQLSPDALTDLENVWSYIGLDNPDAADRVLEAVHQTVRLLSRSPELGVIRRLPSSDLLIRSMTVRRYPNYIIYYHPASDGVQVLRVLHGARDHARMFGPKEKP